VSGVGGGFGVCGELGHLSLSSGSSFRCTYVYTRP
jgi:hypothetical protein